MKRDVKIAISVAVIICIVPASVSCQSPPPGPPSKLDAALEKFTRHTGAEIVFTRDDLPPGKYHDVMKPLADDQKLAAVEACMEEARLYPPGFFGQVGLRAIGVFAVCVSKSTTDSHREYDEELGGYRYYGVYNGNNAIASSFYSVGQLELTLHHEIFHHVDSTADGVTEKWLLSSDDAFYQAAVSGSRPYSAPPIPLDDLEKLRSSRIGTVLKDAVSEYAAKNSREDQAETARHMLSMLSSSLVQTIDQPELPGSQRILHILKEYEQAVPDGPGFEWFVDVALKRADHKLELRSLDQLLVDMRLYATGGTSGFAGIANDVHGARRSLKAAVRIDRTSLDSQQANELVSLSAKITTALLLERIRPDKAEKRFNIWGREDSNGANHTLRRDVLRFATDAKRLAMIASNCTPASANATLPKQIKRLTTVQLRNMRLIARYYVFIKSNWSVSDGTQKVFDSAKETILKSLPPGSQADEKSLRDQSLEEIASLKAANI